MMLRKTRWLTAGLLAAAALLASPGRSQAGIEILIQEVDAGGNAVGAAQYFAGTGAFGVTTAHFASVGVTVGSTSLLLGQPYLNNNLSIGVSATLGGSFDPAFGIRVMVTDNGFKAPIPDGQFAVLRNSNSQSSSVLNGTNTVTNNSIVYSLPPTGKAITVLGLPTADATSSVSVFGDSGSSGTTTRDIPVNGQPVGQLGGGLPANFAIQQTITIRATPLNGGSIGSGSTLSGTGTASVQANAPVPPGVPAPGGLVLALIGLPLLGARRLRKKA